MSAVWVILLYTAHVDAAQTTLSCFHCSQHLIYSCSFHFLLLQFARLEKVTSRADGIFLRKKKNSKLHYEESRWKTAAGLCGNECKLERIPNPAAISNLHLDGNVITSLTLRRPTFVWISFCGLYPGLSRAPKQGTPGCCQHDKRRWNMGAAC